MREVCNDFGAGLAEFDGSVPHVHSAGEFPPVNVLRQYIQQQYRPA
jgi:hypothetical protein